MISLPLSFGSSTLYCLQLTVFIGSLLCFVFPSWSRCTAACVSACSRQHLAVLLNQAFGCLGCIELQLERAHMRMLSLANEPCLSSSRPFFLSDLMSIRIFPAILFFRGASDQPEKKPRLSSSSCCERRCLIQCLWISFASWTEVLHPTKHSSSVWSELVAYIADGLVKQWKLWEHLCVFSHRTIWRKNKKYCLDWTF